MQILVLLLTKVTFESRKQGVVWESLRWNCEINVLLKDLTIKGMGEYTNHNIKDNCGIFLFLTVVEKKTQSFSMKGESQK